jgi:hypothetical protein
MSERYPIFDGVSNAELMRIATDAIYGGEELETARTLIRREMAQRCLVTALKEEYVNPPEALVRWATDYDRDTQFTRGRE